MVANIRENSLPLFLCVRAISHKPLRTNTTLPARLINSGIMTSYDQMGKYIGKNRSEGTQEKTR